MLHAALRRSKVAVAARGYRSFAYLARAAGYPADGLRGLIVAKALCAAWLATQRVWRRDESPDLAETMAALDRNLRRFVEPLDGLASPFPGRRAGAHEKRRMRSRRPRPRYRRNRFHQNHASLANPRR